MQGAPLWCEDEASLHSIYKFKHLPASQLHSAGAAGQLARLFGCFIEALEVQPPARIHPFGIRHVQMQW